MNVLVLGETTYCLTCLMDNFPLENKKYDILENKNKDLHIEYKKYLISQLEEILNIMKNKGTHPQDLINFMINKYKRDIK